MDNALITLRDELVGKILNTRLRARRFNLDMALASLDRTLAAVEDAIILSAMGDALAATETLERNVDPRDRTEAYYAAKRAPALALELATVSA